MWRAVTIIVVLTVLVGSSAARQPTTQPQETLKKVKVLSVSGNAQKLVSSNGGGKWQPLRAGEELDELTVIRTGFRSKVVLKFSDRGEVVINNATKVGISEFRKKGKLVRARIGLKYGTMGASVSKSAGPNDFQVDTPVATLSVRGTTGHIGFTGDLGLGMRGTAGRWLVAWGRWRRTIRPGEMTDSERTMAIELAQRMREVIMGDVLGGLTESELRNLRNNGSGRGLSRFTGSNNGSPFSPFAPAGGMGHQGHQVGEGTGPYIPPERDPRRRPM